MTMPEDHAEQHHVSMQLAETPAIEVTPTTSHARDLTSDAQPCTEAAPTLQEQPACSRACEEQQREAILAPARSLSPPADPHEMAAAAGPAMQQPADRAGGVGSEAPDSNGTTAGTNVAAAHTAAAPPPAEAAAAAALGSQATSSGVGAAALQAAASERARRAAQACSLMPPPGIIKDNNSSRHGPGASGSDGSSSGGSLSSALVAMRSGGGALAAASSGAVGGGGGDQLCTGLSETREVLDEDVYSDAVGAIIERDYFPHLAKMTSQLEWLRAVRSGDPSKMRQAQINIAHRRAGLKTPGANAGAMHPPSSHTPYPTHTPAGAAAAAAGGMGSVRGGAGSTPASVRGAAAGGWGAVTPAAAGGGHGGGLGVGMSMGRGGGAHTPGLMRTPAMTPLHGGGDGLLGSMTPGSAAAAVASSAPGAVRMCMAHGGEARAPDMRLDAFMANYTSEDAVSFNSLMTQENARKRAKVAHHLVDVNVSAEVLALEDAQRLHAGRSAVEGGAAGVSGHAQLALIGAGLEPPPDECGSSGQPSMTLAHARHTPLNNLFYDSSTRTDAPVSRKEVSEQAMGPPKAINTAATRFSAAAAAAGHRSASGGAGGGMMGGGGSHMSLDVHGAAVADAMGLGSVHGAGHDQLPGGAPLPGGGTMGYGSISTPALPPDASPFMTWGELGATPLRLDGSGMDEDALLAGLGLEVEEGQGGPAFHVQRPPAREMAGRRLAAAKAGTGATGNLGPHAAAGRNTGGGGGAGVMHARGGSRGGTPLLDSMRRHVRPSPVLSHAARQLAARLHTPARAEGGGGVSSGGISSGFKHARPLPSQRPGHGHLAVDGLHDAQLRASYLPCTAAASGGGGASALRTTPVHHGHGGGTPLMMPQRTPGVTRGQQQHGSRGHVQQQQQGVVGAGKRSAAAAFFDQQQQPQQGDRSSVAGCSMQGAGDGGGVTDGLLKL